MRAAVLGMGFSNHSLPLCAYLKRVDDVAAVMCFDDDPELADVLAAASGGRAADSLDAVLDFQPDVCLLTGDARSKLPWGTAALRAGIPTLVDKHMGRSPDECDELVAVARETGTPLYSLFPYRFKRLFLRLRSFLEDTDLGRLRHASMAYESPPPEGPEGDGSTHWYRDPQASAGGGWFYHGDHALDWVHWLLGERVVEARGWMRHDDPGRLEYGGMGAYELAGGASCYVGAHVEGTPVNRRSELWAVFDRGGFHYTRTYLPAWTDERVRVVREDGSNTLSDEWLVGADDGDLSCFERGIGAFLAAVRETDAPPALDPANAGRVHVVAAATYRAARTNEPTEVVY